ncbi:MAG TPA: GMC family oxidoreductase [Solirubrobacteraceae bacterium]|jgi:cholesterol oxidase|nr:GMC family oxidoreductase [Solirubrobacteraceae bacterium]
MTGFDYDWLVIGSGFGGSVSALRLAEKGYSVAVLECGRRFTDADFAERTADFRRYNWAPHLGMRGILRLSIFRDVFVLSGCGVGGGSLGYANTLYRARPSFYDNPQWARLADWANELAPFYSEAERMLGVENYDRDGVADVLLREYAETIGVGESYKRTPVGVFLGESGKTVPDPYFGGAGPERTGCLRCGSCMIGCRHGAKNTLMKNYLWFAERLGVEIFSERMVTDVRPLGDGSGADGYEVAHERSGGILRREPRTVTARGVIVAAGALGTNRLLQRCKLSGSLGRISDRLGHTVRTNSEAIISVTAPEASDWNFSDSVAITSSIYTDPDTHIEVVTYGDGGDSQGLLRQLMVTAGGRGTRPLHFLLAVARHPRQALGAFKIRGMSRRTIILLVMQSLDNSMRLKVKRRLPNGSVVLTTEQDPLNPNPDSIPAAYDAARWFAKRIGGTAYSGVTEAVLGIPLTAHILGGAVIGESPETGVIDARHRVFGYENLLVCDGAAVPANVGANPSLTITALAERALTFVGPKHDQEGSSALSQARQF